MSIYQKSFDDLILAINAKTGTTFLAAQLQATSVRPTKVGESAFNTKIRIDSPSTSIYRGGKVFYYDRLDLAGFSNFGTFLPSGRYRTAINAGAKVSELLNDLRDSIGVTFDMTDLEDNVTYIDESGGCSVLLKAKPGSVGWIGEFALKFAVPPNIINAFFSPGLVGFD